MPTSHLPASVPSASSLLRRTQSALGLMREIVQESSAEHWYTLGVEAAQAQQWYESEHSFRKVVQVNAKHWRGQLQLAAILALLDQSVAAAEAVCAAFNMPFSSWLGFEEELSLSQWTAIVEAIELSSEIEDPIFQVSLAAFLSKTIVNSWKISEEAEDLALLIRNKEDFGLWHKIIEYTNLEIAKSAEHNPHSQEAITNSNNIISLNISTISMLFQRATTKQGLDHFCHYENREFMYNYGIDDYEAVLRYEPTYAADYIIKAKAEYDNGYSEDKGYSWDNTMGYYNQAITCDPFDPTLYILRAKHGYFYQNNNTNYNKSNEEHVFKSIGDDLDTAVRLNPRLVMHRVHYKIHICKDLQGALDDTSYFINNEPTNYKGYQTRARIKEKMADYDGAVNDYQASYSLNTKYVQLYTACANVYIKNLADYDNALKIYDSLLYNNPEDTDVYPERAKLKSEILSDYEGALRDYNQWLTIKPHDLRASLLKGILHTKFGFDDEAIEALNKVIDSDTPTIEYGTYQQLLCDAYSCRADVRKQIGDLYGADNDHDISERIRRNM